MNMEQSYAALGVSPAVYAFGEKVLETLDEHSGKSTAGQNTIKTRCCTPCTATA